MVWDPLRKKEVKLTPEEKVRQWFISVLEKTMLVPAHMMMSEVGLPRKGYRADIVVYGRDAQPLAVVECKREDVELTGKVLAQALRYHSVLDVRYLVITNGKATCIFRKSEGKFAQIRELPSYAQMCEP